MNVFCGIGNATREPETKVIGNDNPVTVARFTVAINRSYKKNGDWAEETTYLDCEAWGYVAEKIGKKVVKGSKVSVEGRLKTDSWTDKDSGQNRSKTIISVQKCEILKTPETQPQEKAPAPF